MTLITFSKILFQSHILESHHDSFKNILKIDLEIESCTLRLGSQVGFDEILNK